MLRSAEKAKTQGEGGVQGLETLYLHGCLSAFLSDFLIFFLLPLTKPKETIMKCKHIILYDVIQPCNSIFVCIIEK